MTTRGVTEGEHTTSMSTRLDPVVHRRWYDPALPLSRALAADPAYSSGSAVDGAEYSVSTDPLVGQAFASGDRGKFVSLHGGSRKQVSTAIGAGLTALNDAGLGAMASADALAWLCVAQASGTPLTDLPELVARWERFTNHGWLAHLAGFSIDEVERGGSAPDEQAVQWLLAMQGKDLRRRVPKVRTDRRVGSLHPV